MNNTPRPISTDERQVRKIESVLDNLHCGLRGDQTEKLARQMHERGVRVDERAQSKARRDRLAGGRSNG